MQNLGKLEKVAIRQVWQTEYSHFTPWLAHSENIIRLGEEINIEMEVLGQEERIGPFRADILCKDTANERYVLIENQFGKTDHTHLGQILTYASGLEAFTIVWIAEKFVEEHRAVLDWLNRITDETVEFFGIEIELFKIGNSDPAPKFNIVSKPNNWSKTIKRTAANASITELRLIQQDYWSALKEYIENQKAPFRLQKPLPQNWTNIALGRSDFRICIVISLREKWITVSLTIAGTNGIEYFKKLKTLYQKDASINLSSNLNWKEKEGKEQQVILFIPESDPNDKSEWHNQHKLIKEWVEKFKEYFQDKIRAL